MSRARMLTCAECGRRRAAADGDMSTSLCAECHDLAGLENEHSDGHHDDRIVDGCPACRDQGSGMSAVEYAHTHGQHDRTPRPDVCPACRLKTPPARPAPDLERGYAITIEYVQSAHAATTTLYRGGISDLTMVKTCLEAFAFLHPTWTVVGVQVLANAPGRETQIMPVLDL